MTKAVEAVDLDASGLVSLFAPDAHSERLLAWLTEHPARLARGVPSLTLQQDGLD